MVHWIRRWIYRLYLYHHWIKTMEDGSYWRLSKRLLRPLLLTIRWQIMYMAIQKIIDGIYIGDVASLMESQGRKELRIKALLCCAREINPNLDGIEDYMWMPLFDCDWISPEHIEDGIGFIKDHKPVLVACVGGASRSASIILAYMISEGWDMNDALSHMQKIRPVINPHPLMLLSIRRYFKIPPY